MSKKRGEYIRHTIRSFDRHIGHNISARGYFPGILMRVFAEGDAVVLIVKSNSSMFPQRVFSDSAIYCDCGEGRK